MINIQNILKSTSLYVYFKGSIEDLYNRWNEPHRYYHNLKHLENIIDQINMDRDKLSDLEYDILIISAIYHDIVYLPREDSLNIKESIEKFKKDFPGLYMIFYKLSIVEVIESTNYHNFEDKNKLIRLFNSYDMNGILNGSLETLIEDGDNIAKEYHLEPEVFKKNRIKFLEKYKKYNPNIQKCIDYLKE
jgi:predicted metal-dependent HD superfamily phosphohydrolase